MDTRATDAQVPSVKCCTSWHTVLATKQIYADPQPQIENSADIYRKKKTTYKWTRKV